MSLANIANPLFGLNQFYRASQALVKAVEIFRIILGEEHDFTKNVRSSLRNNYEIRVLEAKKNKAPIGLILLALESQPSKEMPPNPSTEDGKKLIAKAITEDLINAWDDIITNASLISVLIISCPEFEEAVSLALSSSVAKNFVHVSFRRINIPRIDSKANVDDVAASVNALYPLFEAHNQVLAWINENQLQAVMVKPVANRGAIFERTYLNWILKKQNIIQSNLTDDKTKCSSFANDNVRSIMIEIVPFDGCDGPLTGLYTGDANPRPIVSPTSSWHEQKYKPGSGDNRATGTFYLNFPAIRTSIENGSKDNVSSLEDWSMDKLLSVAMSDRTRQCDIFEDALSKLMLVLMAGQINFNNERGLRGYTKIISEEFEGLPT